MKKVYAEHYFKSRGLTARLVNEVWEKNGKRNKCYIDSIWIDGKLAFTDVMVKVVYDGRGKECLSVHQIIFGQTGWFRTYLLK